jgi:hypothetical protein
VQGVPAHQDPQKRGPPKLWGITLREIRGGLQRSRREDVTSAPSNPLIMGARSGPNVSLASNEKGLASHNSMARV